MQIPQDSYSANFMGDDAATPEYRAIPAVGSGNNMTWPTTRCTIKFNVPTTMKHPVFVHYRLTHFFQNHRRYIKSMDSKQLAGSYRSAEDLKGSGCEPLATVVEGSGPNAVVYPIYPCGLIANSIFNGKLYWTGLFQYGQVLVD